MTSDDLLPMIWDALGADRLTTLEATDRLEDLFKYRCPDDLAKTLMKFRKAWRTCSSTGAPTTWRRPS